MGTALTLSEYQPALPLHSVLSRGSDPSPPEPLPGAKTVELTIKPEDIEAEAGNLVEALIRLHEARESVAGKLLLAAEVFASAVSQADYKTSIIPLGTALDITASAIKEIGGRDARPRTPAKNAGPHAEHEGAPVDPWTLRNAIAHGKAGRIDLRKAEEIAATPASISP